MKRLFLYYIKKRTLATLVVALISLIVTIVVTTTYYGEVQGINGEQHIYKTYFFYLSFIMLLFASLIPIYEFSFKMKKNTIDLFYSLPVKRYKLYLVKYLIGLIELFIIFTVSYLYIIIFVIISINKTSIDINMVYYVYYYFLALGLGFLLFNWISFFYTQGNTIHDGLIIAFLSVFALVFVCSLLFSIRKNFSNDLYQLPYVYVDSGMQYTPYSQLVIISDYFDQMVKYNDSNRFYLNYGYDMKSFIIMPLLSSLLVPLFFIINNKKKAEDTMGITSTWYTYDLFIPLYVLCFLVTTYKSIIIKVVAIISGYIGYVIKNRDFKIKKKDLITLVVSALVGIIIASVIGLLVMSRT